LSSSILPCNDELKTGIFADLPFHLPLHRWEKGSGGTRRQKSVRNPGLGGKKVGGLPMIGEDMPNATKCKWHPQKRGLPFITLPWGLSILLRSPRKGAHREMQSFAPTYLAFFFAPILLHMIYVRRESGHDPVARWSTVLSPGQIHDARSIFSRIREKEAWTR